MGDEAKPRLSREQFEKYKEDRKAVFGVALGAAKDYRDAIIDVGKIGPTPANCEKLTTTVNKFQEAAKGVFDFANYEKSIGLPIIAAKTESDMTKAIELLQKPGAQAKAHCDKMSPTI